MGYWFNCKHCGKEVVWYIPYMESNITATEGNVECAKCRKDTFFSMEGIVFPLEDTKWKDVKWPVWKNTGKDVLPRDPLPGYDEVFT